MATPGVRVRCRVIDARTEEPISGARIEGFNARGRLGGFTDGEGIFQTLVLPGESSVLFHSPPQGFYTAEPGFSVDWSQRFEARGEEMSLTLRAPPLAGRLIHVRGRIVNFREAGSPRTVVDAAAGSFQTSTGGRIPLAPVDGEGGFELSDVPEGRNLYVLARSLDHRWAAAAVLEAREPAISLALVPARPFTGRLDLPDGTALASARITLKPVVGNEVLNRAEEKASTDDEGFLQVEGVMPGLEYLIAGEAGQSRRTGEPAGEPPAPSWEPFRRVLVPGR